MLIETEIGINNIFILNCHCLWYIVGYDLVHNPSHVTAVNSILLMYVCLPTLKFNLQISLISLLESPG